ncbi:MAG: hypothetical protein ACXVEF_12125 [Polyangiales bacterium]
MTRFSSLLLVTLFIGCSSESTPPSTTDAGSDASKSCTEGGKTHASGESWTCSDGCNHCTCMDGVVASTTLACGCSDSTGFHARGDSWKCPDGCNTCICNADFTISSTLIACDAGPLPDSGDAGSD